MSAKRKPNQNSKNCLRPSSAQHVGRSANSSNSQTNLRKNGIGSLDELNFTDYFRDSDNIRNKTAEESDNSSDFEDDEEIKGHRSKKGGGIVSNDVSKKIVPESNENHASSKVKPKKEPLPMKLRAFPQSFWQQPNKTPTVSPGTVYCITPPLSKEENPSETREENQTQERQEIVVSKANVDLLFSLFRNVEEEQRKSSGNKNVPSIRRGRPKKSKTELSKVVRDEDPYLTSSATELFLPLLSSRGNGQSLQSKIFKDEQILAMVSIDGSSSNLLSSVNVANQNYSQILSELVVQL